MGRPPTSPTQVNFAKEGKLAKLATFPIIQQYQNLDIRGVFNFANFAKSLLLGEVDLNHVCGGRVPSGSCTGSRAAVDAVVARFRDAIELFLLFRWRMPPPRDLALLIFRAILFRFEAK